MRAKHTKHDLPAFPVYSSAFLSDTELVIGGGGGQAKTGIKNKLVRGAPSPPSLSLNLHCVETIRNPE